MQWWEHYEPQWRDLTCCKYTSDQHSAKRFSLMHIERMRQHPALVDGMVSGGGNSGHEAVSLAYNLGAAEIVLVGFDMMQGDDGKQHYHGDHRPLTNPGPNLYKRWIRHMHELAASIESRGVSVRNATPRSALKLRAADESL